MPLSERNTRKGPSRPTIFVSSSNKKVLFFRILLLCGTGEPAKITSLRGIPENKKFPVFPEGLFDQVTNSYSFSLERGNHNSKPAHFATLKLFPLIKKSSSPPHSIVQDVCYSTVALISGSSTSSPSHS